MIRWRRRREPPVDPAANIIVHQSHVTVLTSSAGATAGNGKGRTGRELETLPAGVPRDTRGPRR